MSGAIGVVRGLRRFPVKSMAGESVERLDVRADGVAGDRAYALFDRADGSIVTARRTAAFPGLLDCRAVYASEPRPGLPAPPVRITLTGGVVVESDAPDADRTLSEHFDRDVELRRTEAGGFVDCEPLSIVTTTTLRSLAEARPSSDFDERRFRMNVLVELDHGAAGFPENAWIGRTVECRPDAGDGARLAVVSADPRCMMVTLPVAELPADRAVLETIIERNALAIDGEGPPKPCVGVYASVARDGGVAVGDRIALS